MSQQLLFSCEAPPSGGPWSHAILDAFRQQGDPLADAAVEELCRETQRGADLLQRLQQAAQRGGACRRLLQQVNTIPHWVSFDRMRPGMGLAFRNLIPSGLALMCGSLVESFAAADGAKVLVRTGQLQSNPIRRVFETAQFTHSLAVGGGPRPGNLAHDNLVRVRLIHAFVRRSMLKRGDWKPEWGHPVNQEDYAGTLMMFSHVYARSLRVLGVPLSEDELDAIHQVWQYCGYLLGVDPALLTANRTEEAHLYTWITTRQFRPDSDSRALTHSLLAAMASHPPFFFPLEGLQALSRAMLGDRLADAMALPPTKSWRYLARPLQVSLRTQSRLGRWPVLKRVTESAGKHLSELILRQGLGATPATFNAPPSARQAQARG